MFEVTEADLARALSSPLDVERVRADHPLIVVRIDSRRPRTNEQITNEAMANRSLSDALAGFVVVAIADGAGNGYRNAASGNGNGNRGDNDEGNGETETDVASLAFADVTLDPTDTESLGRIAEMVGRSPLASVAFVELLRRTEILPPLLGLQAESAVYSMLQAGPEFAAWKSTRRDHPPSEPEQHPVLVERDDDRLIITLNRPRRHNAWSLAMRDQMAEALQLVEADSSITSVILRGAGRSFCSGGDLDEFGSAPDPATAYRIRLDRSVAALLWRVRDRVAVNLHGACIGAGIELAAIARRVTASPTATIGLPELAFGLVPGAGGTVSLTKRIGRHRTAWLALTNARIEATTAVLWGLADELVSEEPR